MAATAGLTKVSHSHHEVYTDGDLWLKVARDGSAQATEEILTDARVLDALGVDVSVHEWFDGRTAHATPTLGLPCTDEHYDPPGVLFALRRSWGCVDPSRGPDLADATVMVERTAGKVRSRVLDPLDREWLFSHLPHTWPAALTRVPRGICHTDPHAGNVLVESAGGLVVIDWESAVYGPVVLDEGCVAFSLWLAGRRDEAAASMSDAEVSAPIVMTKAVSAASWAWPRLGRDAMLERVRAGEELLRACGVDAQA